MCIRLFACSLMHFLILAKVYHLMSENQPVLNHSAARRSVGRETNDADRRDAGGQRHVEGHQR